MLGLKFFRTATFIISRIEAMHIIKKGQLASRNQSVQNQVKIMHQLFGLAAEDQILLGNFSPLYIFLKYLHQNRKFIYFFNRLYGIWQKARGY